MEPQALQPGQLSDGIWQAAQAVARQLEALQAAQAPQASRNFAESISCQTQVLIQTSSRLSLQHLTSLISGQMPLEIETHL